MGEAPTPYLSTRQAAALLGLSPRTLERYRVTGGGPPYLTYCNRVHYLRSDLDVWALEGRRRSTSDDGGAARANGTAGKGQGPRNPSGQTEAEAPIDTAAIAGVGESASGHLGVRELAALLQVSRRTLDRYRAKGIGPAYEKVNGRVRYRRADVEAWLSSGRRASVSGGRHDPSPDTGECAGVSGGRRRKGAR